MRRRGPKLKAGMTLAIEPMVNLGTERIRWMSDNWTVVTADRKESAHYENTILITKKTNRRSCRLQMEIYNRTEEQKMDRWETGMLAKSLVGHDKDKVYVIVGLDEQFTYLADRGRGKRFRVKKKKKKHVQLIREQHEISKRMM